MIKAVLFDLGDMVFNPDWKSMNEKMVEETGLPILMSKEMMKIYHDEVLVGTSTMEEMIKKSIDEKGLDLSVEKFITAYKKNYEKYSPINGDVLDLIKRLRREVKIFALSNTNSIHKEVNKGRGLFNNFDEVFLSFEIGIRKPNPEIYNIILDKVRLNPQEIVFIDDNEENIERAKSLGFIGIKYNGFESLLAELKKYDLG